MCIYGSFARQGDPNADPKTLKILSLGPRKDFGKPAYRAHGLGFGAQGFRCSASKGLRLRVHGLGFPKP